MIKTVYSFNVNKTEKVEEVEITKDEKGAEIKTTKQVEKLVPHKILIKRPSRSESDESDIFRAAEESELIRRGVITSTLLNKRLNNDGGILSEEQKKTLQELENNFVEKQGKYKKLSEIPENERTEGEKKESETLLDELSDIMSEIQRFNDVSSNLYNRTAEALARNKTILWLTLFLSYEEKDGKEIPIFSGKTYEEKLKIYDSMEEKEDAYDYDLIQKLMLLIGSWYMGKTNTKEDFDLLLAMAENRGVLNL